MKDSHTCIHLKHSTEEVDAQDVIKVALSNNGKVYRQFSDELNDP